ncbi:N-sulfoglucosamine sulfohydrolase [Elysia marginata]|uniref:N-sulfoglucosamine sulfohydrolase n=1 Tax=Elysia marginata TaxID=1093978 RepID=A0AAV4GXK8_9GAST|nr:N-sulfoglucosamine sulfohydrolase [Elysia marginata]
MDFTPTVLDWFNVKYPEYKLNGQRVKLTGRSLLPLAANPDNPHYTHTYASHQWHGITMGYPMRVLVNSRYRLIHNINWRAPYPMATQIYPTSAFQGILNATRAGKPTGWYKTLHQYYYRAEWELYDLYTDPKELNNLANDAGHKKTLESMKNKLNAWLVETNDPWRCMPHSVLLKGECHLMDNEYKQ